MAGPFGFFKGLGARVLYTMPATAICWSTYEFFKFMLSSQTHDDYRSTISGSRISATNQSKISDMRWGAAQDDVSSKNPTNLRYVIPKPTVIATDIISDSSTATIHHSASTEIVPGSPFVTTTTTRELPSIAGVGIYTAITHSVRSDPGVRSYDR